MKSIEQIIGQKVRHFRESAGMSQGDLVKNAKSSVTTISRLENGHQLPQSDNLIAILQALGRTTEDLFEVSTTGEKLVGQMTRDEFLRMIGDQSNSEQPEGLSAFEQSIIEVCGPDVLEALHVVIKTKRVSRLRAGLGLQGATAKGETSFEQGPVESSSDQESRSTGNTYRASQVKKPTG